VAIIVDVKAGDGSFRGEIIELVSSWTAQAMKSQRSLPVRYDRPQHVVLDLARFHPPTETSPDRAERERKRREKISKSPPGS
jgi:hypothetical protein